MLTKIILKITILAICYSLWGCNISNLEARKITTSARLVRIVSGQTIEVIISEQNKRPQRIRIMGIDVPQDNDSSWRQKAKTRLSELITAKKIDLEIEDDRPDRYNRIFAHLWQDDVLISEQLAKEGYVLANTQYPHKYSDRIFYAREYARILGYGIWE